MSTKDDYTPNHLKIEGAYENDRNNENNALYKAIIRMVFGVQDVICGHHLVYEVREKREDGFTYTFTQEIPSADALIFDHGIAQKLWGDDYRTYLKQLAVEPTESRDTLLRDLFYARYPKEEAHG